MAKRAYRSLAPTPGQLSSWLAAFSLSLLKRGATPRTWSYFYSDVVRLSESCAIGLDLLRHSAILLDQRNKLRSAVGQQPTSEGNVFIPDESIKRTKSHAGVPMPPGTLTR